MSESENGYGGGGGGTTTTTTTTTLPPFNPEDEFPAVIERTSDISQPCTQIAEDYSGPEKCHLIGISHFETTFTSKTINGGTYKYNGRLAYRNASWSTKQITHLWIYYDSLSCCWRLTHKGTIDSPIAEQKPIEEYSDSEGNSLGFYIPNLLIDYTRRGVYLQGEYINPNAGSSSPVGDWLCSAGGSISEQEVNPILTCTAGEAPDNTYEQITGSKDFTSYSSAQGHLKILGDENGECVISFFEPTHNENTFAKRRYVKIIINNDNSVIFDSEGPQKRILHVGDTVKFNMVNGKDFFLVSFAYLKIGSFIGSVSAGGNGGVSSIGQLSGDRTIGSSFSMSDNKVHPKDKYVVNAGEGVSFAQGFTGGTHSPYDYCFFDSAEVTSLEGGYESVTINYKGFWNNRYSTISIQSSTNTDPIDSHPEFCEFGGDKEEPKNGAIFRDDETFDKFELYIGSKLNEFAGVKSYLSPNYIVTEKIEYAFATFEDLKSIGRVQSPGGAGGGAQKARNLARGQRNFLVTSVSWQAYGQGCIVTKNYRLSGKNGWDSEIYD
jgi:hypothetical protein